MSAADRTLWLSLADAPAVDLGATVLLYVLAIKLQRRFGGSPVLNPTMVAVLFVVAGLELTGASYESYQRGVAFLPFMLGPAVALLAVPLFRQTALIRASGPMIIAALSAGLPCGILSAVGAAWLFGAHRETLVSIAPKSVTTGIAIGVSQAVGGVPALTATFVILTGIVGAVGGPAAARLVGVRDERALGLAMGIGSHGIGTARALRISEIAGAFSGLGMSLNGVLTAVLLPAAMTLLHP
ncbi:MAG: LrgB family protein [Acetobacteraceae bacterium]|nr:LrgB family protein [Acetobacteraceae bacterium]